MVRRTVHITLLVLLSLAILLLAARLVGIRETAAAIREGGAAAFWSSGLLLAVQVLLQAHMLAVLGRAAGHRIPFRTYLKAMSAGLGAAVLIPGGYVGGEPIKVLYLRSRAEESWSRLAGTILLAKCLEVLSFMLVLGVSALLTVGRFGAVLFSGRAAVVGVFLLALPLLAIGGSLAVGGLLLRQRQVLTHAAEWLAGRFPRRRALQRLAAGTAVMEQQAATVFRGHGRAVAHAIAALFLFHLVVWLRPGIVFGLGWEVRLGAAELGLIFLVTQVLHAVQVTPSGVGTLDGGMFAMLALAGLAMTAPQCLAFLLYLRFWDAILAAIGGLLCVRAGIRLARQRRPEDGEAPAAPAP